MQGLVKTDVTTKKCLTWSEDGCFPSEPVFVGNPAGTKEDDGMYDYLVSDLYYMPYNCCQSHSQALQLHVDQCISHREANMHTLEPVIYSTMAM